MNLKNKAAIFSVGDRSFEIPVHEELVQLIEISESALKIDSYELKRFILGFLTRETVTAYLKIGIVSIPFEIPRYASESLEVEVSPSIPPCMLSEDLGQIIRKMIPTDLRPASERQLSFAKQIASTLSIEFPNSAGTSFLLCSEFINMHIDAFNERSLELKSYGNMARRAARGYATVWLILSTEEKQINDFVLQSLNVSQVATLKKHIENLVFFLEEYPIMELPDKNVCLQACNRLLKQEYSHINCPEVNDEIIQALVTQRHNLFEF